MLATNASHTRGHWIIDVYAAHVERLVDEPEVELEGGPTGWGSAGFGVAFTMIEMNLLLERDSL